MKHWSLIHLDIIATNAVLGKEPVAPRIIAPVFRDRTSGAILLPPFSLIGDELFNAHESNEADYRELVEREQLAPLEAPIPAKTNHDLWVNEQGEARYEPKNVVKKNFESIFSTNMEFARQRFQNGDYAIAAKHAFTAGAVNPSHIEPLKLRAACEDRLQQCQRFEFTCDIASRYLPHADFRKLVSDFVGAKTAATELNAPNNHGAAAMTNIAIRRSQYSAVAA